MGRKEDKEMDKQMEKQSDFNEESDEQISYDLHHERKINLPSDNLPQDWFEYQKFKNLPDASGEFRSKIDKDVVFANLGGQKPDWKELMFQIGTIELFEGEFVEELQIPRWDAENNKFIRNNKGDIIYDIELRFDEAFRSSLNFLKAEYKFAMVASRALGGNDRASILDISSATRLQKEVKKKKDSQNSILGTGGN